MRWNYYKLRQLSSLQIAMDSYYKLRQLFYYKVRPSLLPVGTRITMGWIYYNKLRQVLQCDGFITNCDRCYKVQ